MGLDLVSALKRIERDDLANDQDRDLQDFTESDFEHGAALLVESLTVPAPKIAIVRDDA